MIIDFDPAKDRANIAKHRVSLRKTEDFDWDNALVVEDRGGAFNEQRFQALGFIGIKLYMLVYTLRGETIRAISLRKATKRKENLWSNQ